MRFFLSLVALLTLLVPAQGTAEDLHTKKNPNVSSKAELYFLQGNWGKAIREYETAVEQPSVENLNRLADAYFYSGDLTAAEEILNKALYLRENPDSIIFLAMLRALRNREYLEKLMPMFQSYPGNPRLWRAVGIVYLRNNYDSKAMHHFHEATKKDPGDYMSYFYIGLIFETRHRYDEAIEAYKKSVAANPNFAQALNNLGYCYKERHYYSYALEMFKKAIAVQPENPGFHYNIGNVYTIKNMIEQAYNSYKRALELDPKFAKAHYNMGRTYIRIGMFKEALKELKLYLKYWNSSISTLDVPPPEAVKYMIEEVEDMMEEQKEKEMEKEKQDNG